MANDWTDSGLAHWRVAPRNQGCHWLLDNKRQEYSTILQSIAASAYAVIAFRQRDNEERRWADADTAFHSVNVMYGSLFVAKQIRELNAMER
jgi:hypothetical protein